MPKVTVYTTQFCPYCHAVKSLLKKKGADYSEVDVSFDPAERQRMAIRANGRRTVPQIFIGEKHIGGCDDLHTLEREGRLDPLLQAS
jgi:glutaredoxin 3